PSRKVNELDTRGSHFYLALYWAEELSKQTQDTELANLFSEVFQKLDSQKDLILEELIAAQGKKINMGGYYLPDHEMASQAMRPSNTFNAILKDSL
ncbi:MAG: NADP-dependent isocitrate dehydrogenase, partial [Bacteroidota bacterium]